MAQSSTPSGDNKGPEAYRTISEVAAELELPQHVLRFWETRFGQVKPMKRAGGRRFYRPQDIELLRGIRHLLYSEGLTIRGVQKVLREQGPRHVAAIGRGDSDVFGEPEAPPPRLKPARHHEDDAAMDAQAFFPFPDDPHDAQTGREDYASRAPSLKPAEEDFEAAVRRKPANRRRPAPAEDDEADAYEPKPSPRVSAPGRGPSREAPDWPETEEEAEPPAFEGDDPLPPGILPEDELPSHEGEGHSGGFRLFDRLKREPSAKAGDASLSREDVRDLQAALFELLECKRLLDRTR
ncbi:DNA-binding transcriptional MerR regulator [Amorphus orientalis]|uniref:DNA-binding transcriptional MerR regulator n=1 Tax=Amorphus orientalis TaxID=649198 RepID=A0AAE4ATD5_9HYPH|nr:DNA-binding transcriptional MerR regulator [Amorphus orientalis]